MPCNAENSFGENYAWCEDLEVVHEDGDRHYCIFHAPKDKKASKSVDEFNELVISLGTWNTGHPAP